MLVKYRLPLEIDGSAGSGAQFDWKGITFRFKAKNGKVGDLEVFAKNFPTESMPRFVAGSSPGSPASLIVPPDPIWPDVERVLMFMEGAMALLGLRSLGFERRVTEWIPENDEDRGEGFVFSFSAERSRRRGNLPVPFDMFARSVIVADQLAAFETPLNFNRRGRISLGEGRYIEAVYEFYFLLETLYADGAFKSKQVQQKFAAASSLRDAIVRARQALIKDAQFLRLRPSDRISVYLRAPLEQVMRQIVEVRGFLHHHSIKRRDSWHPRRQDEYHADAIFLAQTCFEVLGDELFGAMYSARALEEFSKIIFFDPHGAAIEFVEMPLPG